MNPKLYPLCSFTLPFKKHRCELYSNKVVLLQSPTVKVSPGAVAEQILVSFSFTSCLSFDGSKQNWKLFFIHKKCSKQDNYEEKSV